METITHDSLSTCNVVGIVGRAGFGKSTLADILVDNFEFKELTFSEPIKMACMHIFDLSSDQLHDTICKEEVDKRWNLSPRQMFQKVGTDFGRYLISSDIWIKNMQCRLMKAIQNRSDTVISDVRFQNEADFLREQFGAHIIRIERPHYIGTSYSSHESERQGASIVADYNIFNTGTIHDLKIEAIQFVHDILDFKEV